MSIEFVILSFVIAASPGTGVLYTIATGISQGTKLSILAAVSCTLGIIPHLFAALIGLATILHTSALVFNLVKIAGIIYLLYMAWQCIKENGILTVDATILKRSPRKILIDGILINILNPKLSIFFVAFLPQFISPIDHQPLLSMFFLSSFFMFATFVVFPIYGIFASLMRKRVIENQTITTWMRRGFAASFGALAVKLAHSEN